MRRTACWLFLLVPASAQVHAIDAFDKVECGSDIPKALVGRHMSNEPVASIEGRHAALGLKDLGGYEASDRLFAAGWLICGHEFELLLDDRSIVRDVLSFPAHSKAAPGFIGACAADGKRVSGTVVAVLKDQAGAQTLATDAAWRIDEESARFVKLAVAGLRCPRDGIFTADGGR